jgi:D-alanyl-D-alanine carboxypeptidase
MNRMRHIVVALLGVAVLAGTVACSAGGPTATLSSKPAAGSLQTPTPSPTPTPTPIPTFDKARLSIDDPTSVWVVSNKLRPLNPIDYVPADLVTVKVRAISNGQMRQAAATGLETMFSAAAAEGAGQLQIQNAYRSYATQLRVHSRLVASLGTAKADAQSARAGYSEHQTGLAVDIAAYPSKCDIAACFSTTTQGQWLAANSWRFGFILRYPADKSAVTGYIFEPWHFRYIGVELSTEMHTTGLTTLEEFFGLAAAPNYAG